MGIEEKVYIKLNQNLWGLVVAFVALGAAEYWRLKSLFWLSLVVAFFMSISTVLSVLFYTWNYCRGKLR